MPDPVYDQRLRPPTKGDVSRGGDHHGVRAYPHRVPTASFTALLILAALNALTMRTAYAQPLPDLILTGFHVPASVCIDPTNGDLYVVDSSWNRVLRYGAVPDPPSLPALLAVFGQANFSEHLAGSGPAGLAAPMSASVDAQGSLFVADALNSRVLRWTRAASASSGSAADAVLGQPDFNSTQPGIGQSDLNGPTNVWADMASPGAVWVADSSNSRVLRFTLPAADLNATVAGILADAVLGQPNFDTDSVLTPTPATLTQASGLGGNIAGDLVVGEGSYRATVSLFPHFRPQSRSVVIPID